MAAEATTGRVLLSADIGTVADRIRAGGVVAYPTEAVFGIGCRPADAGACERVLDIKGRESAKGLILVTDDLARIAHWLEPIPTQLQARAEATWPGPHTWLWPARSSCPLWLRGTHTRLAVRVSADPNVRALCAAVGSALVSTSANRSGEAPCRDAACVMSVFPNDLDAILNRPCGGLDQPSTIRDVVSGAWIRGGPAGTPPVAKD
jgi:L-threonylcarbamoyladenylate synthase